MLAFCEGAIFAESVIINSLLAVRAVVWIVTLIELFVVLTLPAGPVIFTVRLNSLIVPGAVTLTLTLP